MTKSKDRVTKPKLRGSWGGQFQAQGTKPKLRGLLGSQNRTSGLGSVRRGLWAGSGGSEGVRGGSPRNYGVECFFFISRQKKYI